MAEFEAIKSNKMKYPRPISEPSSPTSSRATTPTPSIHGSDDEDDSEPDHDSNDSYEVDGGEDDETESAKNEK